MTLMLVMAVGGCSWSRSLILTGWKRLEAPLALGLTFPQGTELNCAMGRGDFCSCSEAFLFCARLYGGGEFYGRSFFPLTYTFHSGARCITFSRPGKALLYPNFVLLY